MSPRDKTAKRDAILKAALDLFVERGYHGTAVPLVAERAGVGAGTIYRYFDDKANLVNQLYREWKRRLGDEILHDFPFDARARAQFTHYWRRYIRFAQEHPRAQYFLELHHHAGYLDNESLKIEEQLTKLALTVVDQMQRTGMVKDQPSEVLIALVLGALTGLIKAAWHGHIKLTDDVIEASEQCIWEAIRA